MPAGPPLRCLRLTTASALRVGPRLRAAPSTCLVLQRQAHTPSHLNVPPPLTAIGRRHRQRPASTDTSGSGAAASPSVAAAAAAPLESAVWTDLLERWADGTAVAAPSRVALSEAACLCLSVESPRCYAVYRPCDRTAATPSHFLRLLAQLRTTPSLSLEARRVAAVLVDLLGKAPHPHHPSPWDLGRAEGRQVKAQAIACVMAGTTSGDDAVAWLVGLLRLSDTRGCDDAPPCAAVALLTTAVTERLDTRDTAATRHVGVGDADGDWLLSCSPAVLGAIAAAMLRCSAPGGAAEALALLEAAALSRLSRVQVGASVAPSPVEGATDGAVVFTEAVAVHCAEVAAIRGDAETVTRLIFLLYRARGALGCATLAEHRQQRRSKPRWGFGGLLPWSSSWWGRTASTGELDVAVGGDDADVRFEQAVVRLLKSAMHAVLYHPQRTGDAVEGSVEEALSLWDGLRGGTSWAGLAAMGSELLSFLLEQHVRVTAAAAERGESPERDTHLQRAGLHVYNHLCQAAPSRSRTIAQKEVLHRCVTVVMQLCSACTTTTHMDEVNAAVTLPTVLSAAAAEQTLRLFADVREPARRESVLPYALAASLTLLSTAATDRCYRVPDALFSGLAAYFSAAQSLHFYCVASSGTTPVPAHVAVCGSLILLHVCLLSCTPLALSAGQDGALSSFVQRLCSLAVAQDRDDARQHTEPGMLLLSWLRVSGALQRQLLWSLLLSLKRRDLCWCASTLSVYASPACSTVACAAVSAIRPAPSPAEVHTVLELLYACGNTDNPTHTTATLDSVVSSCAEMPVRTLALNALTEKLQRLSASGAGAAVLVVGRGSLRAMVHCRDAAKDGVTADDSLAALVLLLLPLLRDSAAKATPSVVFLVLTPAALLELQRLRKRNRAASQRDLGVLETLHGALSGSVAHQLLHVSVASAWPPLPNVVAARRLLRGVDAVDGLHEATAAARHLEQTFPRESRPVVGLWVEDELPASTPSSTGAARLRLLLQYGAREASTHRAHLEKAKSDIFSLLRSSAPADAHNLDLRVSAAGAAAETNAARRDRNKSLLRAVSQKGKGHHTL